MDAHHINLVSELAAPSLDQARDPGLEPVVVAADASLDLTATCSPGVGAKAPETQRKRLATLQAVLALKGYELHPTPTGIYIVMRWNWARRLATLDYAQDFAQQLGVQL